MAEKKVTLSALKSLLLFMLFLLAVPDSAAALETPVTASEASSSGAALAAPVSSPNQVEVKPLSKDHEIERRLQSILEATNWFSMPGVSVKEGVVFLSGGTDTAELKKWAENLAHNTKDVVAVVNLIEVREPSAWDFKPIRSGLRSLWHDGVRSIPIVLLCLFIMASAWGGAWLAATGVRTSLHRRIPSNLLRNVVAQAVGFGVLLLGVYIILRIVGLTSVALTLVGGTGLLGIIFGIAFRGISENFLASVFLSVQSPFHTGDLVEITGVTGFVQRLTTRATMLLTLDGNHVQIPNATIYQNKVMNYTANPSRRDDFVVGIGYDDEIEHAQEVALKALTDHPAILKDPEPWVLAENFGAATINLRVYFWFDGNAHNILKVRSSVIRLVKRAFQAAGISMPDEAREMIFPQGVPVHLIGKNIGLQENTMEPSSSPVEPAMVATEAEAGLKSEARDIQQQARHSRPPDEGENLLKPAVSRNP